MNLSSPSQDHKISEGVLTTVSNPNDWVGDRRTVQEYLEPMVLGTIISPSIYLPAIMELCHSMVSGQEGKIGKPTASLSAVLRA